MTLWGGDGGGDSGGGSGSGGGGGSSSSLSGTCCLSLICGLVKECFNLTTSVVNMFDSCYFSLSIIYDYSH